MSLFRGFGHDTRPQVYMEWHERKKFTFPKIRFEGVQRSKENPLVKVFVQSPNPQRVGRFFGQTHTQSSIKIIKCRT